MKRITDPEFIYYPAQSHGDPTAFAARMDEYRKMVAAEPKPEAPPRTLTEQSQAYLAQMMGAQNNPLGSYIMGPQPIWAWGKSW